MDILKLVSQYNQESKHTSHIKESRFVQSVGDSKQTTRSQKPITSILQAILMTFDPIYSGIPRNECKMYLQQKVMDMCSQIDESSEISYSDFKFHSKKMRPKLIQSALQKSDNSNHLSVLYYLNEYYKRHFVIVQEDGYWNTCHKSYPVQTIYHEKDRFSVVDKQYQHLPEKNIDDIPLLRDVKGIPYESGMKAISHYSVADLKQLCESHKISVKENGKAKKKQQLYDEIERSILS